MELTNYGSIYTDTETNTCLCMTNKYDNCEFTGEHICICHISPSMCRANYHICTCASSTMTCRKTQMFHICICKIDPIKCIKISSHDCVCETNTKICIACNHICNCKSDTSNCMSLTHDCVCSWSRELCRGKIHLCQCNINRDRCKIHRSLMSYNQQCKCTIL